MFLNCVLSQRHTLLITDTYSMWIYMYIYIYMYIWMSIYIVGVQSPTGVKSIQWEGAKRGREKREEREAEKGEKRWGEIDIMEHEQWYFRGKYFVNLQPSRSTRSNCPSRVQWFCWGGLESFKQQHIKSQIFQKRTPRTTNIYVCYKRICLFNTNAKDARHHRMSEAKYWTSRLLQ